MSDKEKQHQDNWARALKKVNLEGLFEEFGIPKRTKKLPLRIRIVRKSPPIENKAIKEQTEKP